MDYAFIDGLAQLNIQATPAPWTSHPHQISGPAQQEGAPRIVVGLSESQAVLSDSDAQLIVLMRNSLSDLLAYLEELQAEREEAINLLREVLMSSNSTELQDEIDRFLNKIGA